MKKALPIVFSILTFSLVAQEYLEITYSGSYAEHAFYNLSDSTATNIDNESWDIALSVFGTGIFVNETSVVFGAQNVLYLAPTNNFDDVVNPDDLSGRLLNEEESWDYGAFNNPRDVNDANDLGWGIYDPMTDVVTGDRVFVFRFKNDTYQKLQITSLDQGIYTIKHADLDGGNETTLTVDKADFPDNQFAFLSLPSGQTLDNVPGGWDLLFTRYSTPVDDGTGGFFDLVVSGVLSAPGIEVAEARGVDPFIVEYPDYVDSLSADLDVIGYDWKEFNNVEWILATDLAYFIKRPNGQVWRMVFLTFGGSSTGKVEFEKLAVVVNAVEDKKFFDSFAVYPNPINETSAAVFSLHQSGPVKVGLTNMLGQMVWSGNYHATSGLNAIQLPDFAIPSGTYFLSLYFNGEVITEKVYK